MVYYHVTPAKNVASILRRGLIPKGAGSRGGYSPALKHTTHIYLWTSLKSAYFFMDEMSEYHEEPHKLAVLEVTVPQSTRLYADPEMGLDLSDGGFIRGVISPANVKLLDVVSVNEPGLPTVMERKYPRGVE